MGTPTLKRQFELDAGHRLCEHDFECQNLHGHRYRFEIKVSGDVDDETGMIVDFAHLKAPVMEAFDHNLLLNERDPLLDVREELERNQEKELYLVDGEPTAENIAEEALDLVLETLTAAERSRLSEIEVELSETPSCSITRRRTLADE